MAGPLRFLTCGSVDDGKSTLIGRLLHESQQIMEDTYAAIARDSRRHGTLGDEVDLALLVDGLEAEREQGITIDVAYRFFSTPRRGFIAADTPGHAQYTRNMATGASNCDLAILLVDARRGLLEQTRRHAMICAMFGIRHVVIAVNKMDLVDFSPRVFQAIEADWAHFSRDLGFRDAMVIPLSARFGDQVTTPSPRMSWYVGPTLLGHLEEVPAGAAQTGGAFRLPVQLVNRPNQEFRGYCGEIMGGGVAVGDAIVVARSGAMSRVSRILGADGDVAHAVAGDAVTLCLADELDIARGDVLAPPDARPTVANQFAARILWLDEDAMLPGRQYRIRMGQAWSGASITTIRHRLDVGTGDKQPARQLAMNEIGVCHVATTTPLGFDPFAENARMGAFILVDRSSNRTVAAGMIEYALRRATNVFVEDTLVGKSARAALKGQSPRLIWLTGLSGSGKSSIAKRVELELLDLGRHVYCLDGDNMRQGLNQDLGFTDADRVENIRRAGEVARLLLDAGLIVIASFISPFEAERRMVRELLAPGEFVEVFVDTPLEECISRDTKGLYARALRGEIPNFTGVTSPYEPPASAELVLRTAGATVNELARRVVAYLRECGALSPETVSPVG